MFSGNSPRSIKAEAHSSLQSQAARQIQDYSQFDARSYINEYYSQIGIENRFLLDFYHNTYKDTAPEARLLEFGGGPTIYQLISAAQQVKEIVFADYLECNRKEVVGWLSGDRNCIDWNQYLDYVLELNNQDVSEENRGILRASLERKVSAVVECDAYQTDVLKSTKHKDFDIVSSGFCLECISSSEEDFISFVKKLAALPRNEGLLVMTLLKNSEFYTINQLSFPTFPIDEEYIEALLIDLGFGEIIIDSVQAELEQGYEGIIALTARKSSNS